MNSFIEKVIRIQSTSPIVGVVSGPRSGRSWSARTGVILLNAGLVHHVGPGRLTVRIARQLAALGHVVARFDHRGVGDSGPSLDYSPYAEHTVDETLEVMAYLQQQYGVDSFWLMGICSGAVTSLKTTSADKRVVGAVLINGGWEGPGNAWDLYVYNRGWARDYWHRNLLRLDSWKKFLTGRSQYRRLAFVLVKQLRDRLRPAKEVKAASSEFAAQLRILVDRGVRLLSVISEGDVAHGYLDSILGGQARELEATGNFRIEVVPFSDHIFTLRSSQEHLLRAIAEWVGPAPGADCERPAHGEHRCEPWAQQEQGSGATHRSLRKGVSACH